MVLRLILAQTLYQQTDSQKELTIQTLEEMLRA